MNRLILPISSLICLLIAEKMGIDKRGSVVGEDMYKSYYDWDSTLSWVVRDLVQEVKGYKEIVSEQGKIIAAEIKGMKSDLKQALDQLDGLKNRIDIIRSEVRLISQQKLTWHNSTQSGRFFSDFAVDGVYRMANDESGMNPIQHTDEKKRGANNMVLINLGGLFKIHTVKLWKRTSTCCGGHDKGLLIYADDTLIGVTSDMPYLNNLHVKDDVYASKIYVKQPKSMIVNLLEIQVFGTGPFGKDEIHC